jgi:hypothetical protein
MSEEKTVLDVVNEALGESIAGGSDDSASGDTPAPSDSEGAVGGDDSDELGGDAEGGEEPEGEGDKAEGEGEETDAEAEARGAERDPVTGKFKKKEAETQPKEEGKKEPPKKDHINDPIPKDLKKETSDRIRTLIDTAKTVTAERDQIKQDFDYLIKGVEATGTTPEQYGEMLSFLSLFNSRDSAQQEKALELVESVAERLAILLGKERTVGDPLAAHADLQDAVKKGQVTAQYAKEIARTRNGAQFRSELTTSAQQQQQQVQQAQREEHEGRTALTELEKTLMASDPDYAAKKAILVPALKPIMANIPWSQKKDKFLEAYKSLRLPKAAAPAPRGVPANQPMRAGKQPAGGQTKAPGSMLEAIDGALAGMKK